MAATFGAATTDRIAGVAALGLGPAFTYIQWLRPTTLTTLRAMINQPLTVGTKKLSLSGTTGNFELRVRRTTACVYVTSNTPLAILNKWYYLAATYDEAAAAGLLCRLYVGDLLNPPKEATYGTATDGTGPTTAELGAYLVGNETAAAAVAWQGGIAYTGAWSHVLSYGAILRGWEHASGLSLTGCRLSMVPGEFDHVNLQHDRAGNGNYGTVTGATYARAPELDTWFMPKRRRSTLTLPTFLDPTSLAVDRDPARPPPDVVGY